MIYIFVDHPKLFLDQVSLFLVCNPHYNYMNYLLNKDLLLVILEGYIDNTRYNTTQAHILI
jgi:hypothetical protein